MNSGFKMGRWRVTDTVAMTRKNLFSCITNQESHIATLIAAGPRSLLQFERSVRVIEKAPDMLAALVEVSDTLNSLDFIQNTEMRFLAERVKRLLNQIDC